MLAAPCIKFLLELCLCRLFCIAPLRCLLVVALVGGVLLLEVEFGDILFVQLQVWRTHGVFHAYTRTCFIDGVNGLIRKETRREIAGRKLDCRFERIRLVFDVVVLFVARRDPLENFDGVILRRLIHHNALESAFESCILFYGLVVFLERCCANYLDLASCKRGLEDIRGIHCALCSTGSDEGVYLVQKENAVLCVFSLFDQLFDSLFELAAVHCSCYDACHIQRYHALGAHALGSFTRSDGFCETLDDRSLADARLADKDGIVLGSA